MTARWRPRTVKQVRAQCITACMHSRRRPLAIECSIYDCLPSVCNRAPSLRSQEAGGRGVDVLIHSKRSASKRPASQGSLGKEYTVMLDAWRRHMSAPCNRCHKLVLRDQTVAVRVYALEICAAHGVAEPHIRSRIPASAVKRAAVNTTLLLQRYGCSGENALRCAVNNREMCCDASARTHDVAPRH